MNNADTTLPMSQPPISSSTDSQPQDTLLQRGAFDPPFTPGTLGRLDRFEVLRLLGEGGMGQVFLAREPRTDARVAVKIMRPQMAGSPAATHSFLTEARHMYRLSHPRILRVLEVSDRKEGPYFVMPYVEGGSLLEQCRSGQRLPDDRILSVARQVAEALAHAHARGLIHRDLKPGNVLLDKEGNAYLTDFGLVRTVFNDSLIDPSESHIEGTVPYMSPAVARGEAEDTRCDIYAFGALLYELLTGLPPYTGRTPQIILAQVLDGPPPPLRTVNPKANPGLVKIAEGCMARELRERYATMADVVADLDRVAAGKMPLGPHGRQNNLPRLVALAAGVLVAGGLVCGSLYHVVMARTSLPPTSADDKYLSLEPEDQLSTQYNPMAVGDEGRSSAIAGGLKEGPFIYTVTNGMATIMKYNGPGGNVMIPSKIGGLPVRTIGHDSFRECGSLTGITVPETVTVINQRAFRDCSALAEVCLTNGIQTIGHSAFYGCKSLRQISLPEGLICIADWAFASSGLERVQLPASLTTIIAAPFAGCARLADVTVKPDSAMFSAVDNVIFNRDKTRLVCAASARIERYVVPASVKEIGCWSFASATNLTHLTIGEGVTNIQRGAFWRCSELRGISLPDDLQQMGDRVFDGCGSLGHITLPNRIALIEHYSFADCTGLTNIVLPQTVQRVHHEAFRSCISLRDITMPRSLGYVGDGVLRGCTSLQNVLFEGQPPRLGGLKVFEKTGATIRYRPGTKGWGKEFGGRPTAVWNPEATDDADAMPAAARAIHPTAKVQGPFTYTTNNGSVTIVEYTGPAGVVTIPDAINGLPVVGLGLDFRKSCLAKRVTGITLPAGVTNIGDGFFNCPCLAAISVDARNPAFSSRDGVLFDKRQATLIKCPQTKTGSYAVPESVTRIGYGAFSHCPGLTGIILPSGVTNIEALAFRGCSGLGRITVPAAVTKIGDAAFAECGRLTGLYFGGDAPANNALLFGLPRDKPNEVTTVFYKKGAKGWGATFGGRPTAVWDPETAGAAPVKNTIAEGAGWLGFRVGATREELIKELGTPDADSTSQWLKWEKHSVHCIIDDKRGASELRFDDGFTGETTAGIEIGSTLKKALAAYGEPTAQEDRKGAKKLIWSSKGILIWFNDDKVSQIVVFPKK